MRCCNLVCAGPDPAKAAWPAGPRAGVQMHLSSYSVDDLNTKISFLFGKPPLTETCPPCLIDSKDGQIVVPHFCSNLCGLSSFTHGPDVPCSESYGGPGWDYG